MLSISAIADAEYYLELGREDYYLAGGEPPGQWIGSAAASLGLGGEVGKDALRALLAGFAPDGRALIQNAGDANHQVGWDLTFSAPKTVSAAWAVAPRDTRQQIQEAHFSAVKAAVGYLERNAAFSRRGRRGTTRDPAGLLVATFEHSTSRAQDPQLHSHCLVMNVGVRPDGTWGTVLSHPFYMHKIAAGAIFRAEFAARLAALGFACRRRDNAGGMFELAGVPDALVKHFSKRREAIEAALDSHGAHGARAAETATLATRAGKEVTPRAELLERWKAEAAGFGFTPESVEALRKHNAPSPKAVDGVVEGIVQEICTQQSHFAKRDVVRRLAEKAPELHLDAESVERIVHERLQHSPEVVGLGEVDHEERYTSRDLLRIEAEMLASVQRLQSKSAQEIEERTVESVLRARPKLSTEQVTALRHLLKADGSIKLVDGMPGTGKTFMLDACRDAWQREGLRVMGCALSAKAARELQAGSNIESCTIAKLVHEWDRGLGDKLKHDARQLLRAAMGKRTYAREGLPLDANTVLVVDEAGMVDTPQMERLCREVEKTGATLVLVGDHRQLPPIGPGGAFQAIAREVGCATLDDMQRQRNSRDLEALRMIADGDAGAALESFRLRDMLTVADSRLQAIEALVSDWVKVGLAQPEQTSIITTTNRDARTINQLCQAARMEMTGASRLLSVNVGEERLFVGDRVLFLENNRSLGVLNGDLGTIGRIEPVARTLSVKLDAQPENALPVEIPLRTFDQLQLGYARTTHKEQGATVEHSFVLLGGSMQSQEISFVQASRHREEVRFYTDRFEAGEDLEDLARQMSASSAKDMAHDVIRVAAAEPERRTGNEVQTENEVRTESVSPTETVLEAEITSPPEFTIHPETAMGRESAVRPAKSVWPEKAARPEKVVRPDSAVQAENSPRIESEVEAGAEVEGEIDSEAEIEAEVEIESEVEMDAAAEIEAEAKIQVKAGIELESEIELDGEIEAESEIEIEPERDSTAGNELERETDGLAYDHEHGEVLTHEMPPDSPERDTGHAERDHADSEQIQAPDQITDEPAHAPPSSMLERIAMLGRIMQGRQHDGGEVSPPRQIPPPSIERER